MHEWVKGGVLRLQETIDLLVAERAAHRSAPNWQAADELKDKQLMYQWLYEKFRRYNAIQAKLDRIRYSREGSRKRTWNYLWGAITSYLDNHFENDNYDNLAAGLHAARISGAVHKTRQKKVDAAVV